MRLSHNPLVSALVVSFRFGTWTHGGEHNADKTHKARSHHTAVMVRFEETLSKLADDRPSVSRLCAEIGVAERTLRMCCAEYLGVGPTRYLLLQRLNKARAALQRANPSTTSVAEIAETINSWSSGALR
jgi:transcriptional regulator GlxA family with amidase domain